MNAATTTAPASDVSARRRADLQWRPVHYVAIAGIGLVLGLRRAENSPDADVLWSARYGWEVLSTGRVPHADTYSWTAAGHHWVPNSWGWNLALGLANRLAGVAGIWAVGVAVSVGLALVLASTARRIGAPPWHTAMAVAAFGAYLLVTVPRAQATGYLLMLAIPPLVNKALFTRGSRAWRAAVVLVAVQLVWINVHSVALLGPAIVACGGAGLILSDPERRRAATKPWSRLAGCVVVTAGACFATPYGTATVTNIAEVRRASVGLISEWARPGFSAFGPITGVVIIVIGAAVAVFAYRARRFDSVAIILLLIVATSSAIRFGPMLAAFLIPEVAAFLGTLNVRPHMVRNIVAFGCAILAGLVMANVGSLGRLSDSAASRRLVSELPSGCRLLNDYVVGGATILYRPDVKVSTDGRNDMYGRDLVLANRSALSNGPDAVRYVDEKRITCVLALSLYPLVKRLAVNPNWRVADRDSQRTLLVRR